MVVLGYCSWCGKPIWGLHKDAAGIEKECDHPFEAIAWLRQEPHQKPDDGSSKS